MYIEWDKFNELASVACVKDSVQNWSKRRALIKRNSIVPRKKRDTRY